MQGVDEIGAATLAVVEAFTEATNRGDVDAMASMVSDDVVFDGTTPPDGLLVLGRAAVRAFWEDLFRVRPHAVVEVEETVVAGTRCTARVRYVFDRDDPTAGHVRAVDVLRVENGLIREKLSYVKG